MLLCPEHRRRLKHPVIYTHHGLFVKLRALSQLCLLIKILQLKYVGASLSSSRHDFWGAYLRKALA